MRVSKIITTCFGIGYIQKGAGTMAALFCCLVWYFFRGAERSVFFQVAVLEIIFFAGVYTSSVVEKEWAKDSNRVVVDEVQGMLMTLFLIPGDWRYVLAGFILFRFFDIAKPLGIKKMENFPGGWGVMMDDLLAGFYSNIVLELAVKMHVFS